MKRFLLFALVATMFAACVTDAAEDVAVNIETPETLTVSFEEESRIQLQNGKTVWTKGDLLSVFYRSNANQKWQFQGKTGDRSGSIARVANAEATQELSNIVVVYPYSENYYINPRTYNVQASLPATQAYKADSYGLDGNVMVSSSEYKHFALKSVCGWLKVQLTGKGEKVKSITLRGNNGEQVAGEIYINSADASCELALNSSVLGDDSEVGGSIFESGTIIKEVTLDCGEGVILGTEVTAFYIALPPQTFEKGLTINIVATDGSKMSKSTSNAITIERNTIQPMATLEGEFEEPIADNEIWYTSTDGEIVTPKYTDVFGANIISNVYKKGKGVITFDATVTQIGVKAFEGCRTLASVELSDSITSIGVSAFDFCGCLRDIILSNNLISIGNCAFRECRSLTSVTIPDSVTTIENEAFGYCSNIETFYGRLASSDGRCLVIDGETKAFAPAGLAEYDIPDGITSIGYATFINCANLVRVTIPYSVTTIGDYAFSGCNNLENITIPNSITKIGRYAFVSCYMFTTITIPESVTHIGDFYTFAQCSNLTSEYCKPTTPPGGAGMIFASTPSDIKIYVPYNSIDAYKSANGWSEYASSIEGYDF